MVTGLDSRLSIVSLKYAPIAGTPLGVCPLPVNDGPHLPEGSEYNEEQFKIGGEPKGSLCRDHGIW